MQRTAGEVVINRSQPWRTAGYIAAVTNGTGATYLVGARRRPCYHLAGHTPWLHAILIRHKAVVSGRGAECRRNALPAERVVLGSVNRFYISHSALDC